MDLSQDFHDLLAAFEKSKARYLLIGGYAVSIHSKPRYTKDIDLWVDDSPTNLESVADALEEFGAPERAIEDLRVCAPNEIVWFGSPPGRVDIFKHIPGVEFEDAYSRKVRLLVGDVSTTLISIDDLIAAKSAAGRPQDLLDIEVLRAVKT